MYIKLLEIEITYFIILCKITPLFDLYFNCQPIKTFNKALRYFFLNDAYFRKYFPYSFSFAIANLLRLKVTVIQL